MHNDNTLQSIARLFGQLVCVLGVIILVGAAAYSVPLESGQLGFAIRRSGVGLIILFLGSSLWLQYAGRRIAAAKAFAAAAFALGVVSLIQFIALTRQIPGPFSFRRDVVEAIGSHVVIGSLAASMALFYLFSGKARAPSSAPVWLAAFVALAASVSVVCQWIYAANEIARVDAVGRDATAACATISLLLLSGGIICSRPNDSLPRAVFASTTKGAYLRRILTLLLLAPAFITLATSVLDRGHLISVAPGSAVLTVVYVLVFLIIALFSVETVVALGKQRQNVEETRELFTARLQEQAAQLQETVARRTHELRHANDHLATLNERLQLALRSSNYGVWELDVASGRLVWDDRMIEIYGLRRPDFKGTRDDWTKRIHPQDAESAARIFDNILAGHSNSYDTVFRVVRPDGSIRHIEAHGFLQRDANGRPAKLAGLNRDISAEQELFEALHVAEQRWKLAIEGTNDAVWDWNINTGYVFHDAVWSGMLGYKEGEIDHSIESWRKLVHPDDLAACEAVFLQHIEQRTPHYQAEYRMRASNGEWRWVLDRGKIVSREADGRAARMVGTHADITARKKMERHLLRTEELAEQVSQIALIGGWELDLATSTVSWSSGVKRIYEVDETFQPTQASALEFFPASARERLETALNDAATKATAFDLELPLDTSKGRRIWVRVQGKTEIRDEKPVRIYGAIQDITAKHESETARRQLEMQLFHAQKMETLGTLAGGIAHDFNNLLTGIIGYHELAAESVPEDHPARACLAESRAASLRARELVEQILTFGRQSSGEGHEASDLSLVVEEARKFLRATLPSNIIITTGVSPNCGPVIADTAQIHQVLLNLGSNAAHAMRAKGGTLHISLQSTNVNADQGSALGGLAAGGYIRLSVSDTGHGMNEATMQRIFDPFFTTKSSREGNGLGLAVVHGIVRAHHGAINVESTIGVGSVFHIYLPAAAEKRPVGEIERAPAPGGSGEMVFIVDDEDIVLRSAKVVLERRGYRVAAFDTAEKCIARMRAENGHCNALITDQTMPGMQGTELVAAAREIIAGLPVVIMSGYFSKIPKRTLDQLGQVKLLPKPFTGNELAATLHDAMRMATVAR
jgi:PAS domain S-box-containing protein